MGEDSVLSDEELEALRATGEGGEAATDGDAAVDGDGRLYDFRDPSRVLNGRLPGLEVVHETFVAGMRRAMSKLLARAVEIETGETTLTRVGDYQNSLPLPVSVHGATVRGREGSMYVVAEGAFVYGCVDAFFGGRGSEAPALERELSGSERRLTALLARHAFDELEKAWAARCELGLGSPSELGANGMGGLREEQILVVSRFHVDMQPGGGDFHLAMPYALLDGLRHHLTAGPRSENSGQRFRARFVEKVFNADIEARAVFPGVRLRFSDLMNLAPGDFIPINRRNEVSIVVGERLLYRAEPGTSEGQAAAKITGVCESNR